MSSLINLSCCLLIRALADLPSYSSNCVISMCVCIYIYILQYIGWQCVAVILGRFLPKF